jgi:hypothetical protein
VPEDRLKAVEKLLRGWARSDEQLSDALATPDGHSRVLAALVVADVTDSSPDQPLATIVDPKGPDLGIDAVAFNARTSQVWLIGVSWSARKTGDITRDTAKLIEAARGFVDGGLPLSSSILRQRLEMARQILVKPSATLTVIYAYPGPPVTAPRHDQLIAALRSAVGNMSAHFAVMDADGIERAIARRVGPGQASAAPADGAGLPIIALAATMGGRDAWSGSPDGLLGRFDSRTAAQLDTFGTKQRIVSIAITDDGREALCGDRDGAISRWDLDRKRLTGRSAEAHTGGVTAIRYLTSGRTALSAGADGMLRRWVLNPSVELKGGIGIQVSSQPVFAFAVSPDEHHVVTGDADGFLRMIDLAAREQVGEAWKGHDTQINAVAMAPDGLEVASASDDGTVRRWRVDGEPLGEPMTGHTGFANGVTYAADGTVLVSVGADGRIVSWDRDTGEQLEQIGDHAIPLHCVLTLPTGRTGLAAGDGGLYPWSLTLPPPASPASHLIEQFANVATDKHSRTDLLGMAADVRRLALLLGAREVAPPLSIALLGDWGTGKSSFMSQLQDQLNGLVLRSAAAPGRGVFVSNIRQVWFNAWHYSDDHLWVGLIEHMFQELARTGGPTPADPKRRAELEARLAVWKAEKDRISAELDAVDRVDVRSGWLGPLRAPFRSARVAAAAGRGLLGELRRPRSWTSLGVIACGIAAVVLDARFGTGLLTAIGALAAGGGTLIFPVRTIWRRMAEWTERAHKKLLQDQADLDGEIRACETELDRVAPEYRLASLLEEIADSARYESFRGLVGRIHHDLRQLDEALGEARKGWDPEAGSPPLERIVLYVDDLDRCLPDRVMNVLQAVNLLLTMDLFMVVIAVDPRWLIASIRKHLTESFATDADNGSRSADPLEYLDKIFHIPFTVRPIGRHAEAYLRDLLPTASEQFTAEPGGSTTGPEAEGATGPAAVSEPVAEQPTPTAAATRTESTPIPEPGEEDAEPLPEQLLVTMAEQDFLAELSRVLPTPRSVKKFSNLYRLLRLSVPANRIGEFAEHGHRPAAVLLAVLVRKPAQARRVLQEIHAARDTGSIATTLGPIFPDAMSTLLRSIDVAEYRNWTRLVARFGFETYAHFEDRD